MAHEATLHGVGVSLQAEGASPPAMILEARNEIVPIFVDRGQAATIEQGRGGRRLSAR